MPLHLAAALLLLFFLHIELLLKLALPAQMRCLSWLLLLSLLLALLPDLLLLLGGRSAVSTSEAL